MKHGNMKEYPISEQPYERGLKYGVHVLSDAELLAVILRTGSKEESSVELAAKILSMYGLHAGLNVLHTVSIGELQRIPGIGKVKSLQLLCLAEISKRMSKLLNQNKISMTEPSLVANYFMEDMRHLKKEQCRVLMFDTKSRLLGEQIISVGTVNASILSPREVFLAALSYEAVHIILLHNHPSGDPIPSKEDLMVTQRIQDSGAMLGIKLVDHIILGDNRYFSLRQEGYMT